MQRIRRRPGSLRAEVHGYSCDGYSSGGPGDVLVLQGARRIYIGDPECQYMYVYLSIYCNISTDVYPRI